MNAHFYVENILEEHVMPFALSIENNFILMQDNARRHVARELLDYLRFVNIPTIDWVPPVRCTKTYTHTDRLVDSKDLAADAFAEYSSSVYADNPFTYNTSKVDETLFQHLLDINETIKTDFITQEDYKLAIKKLNQKD
ncbi:hypothetical protein ILUMI_26782 [Ignelater luminosus]|uniref:Tc1-like transposase DDE domain-containing protein n=1 Tax=Ignelater luminosus TaxID=2038154 RepID=A0A8K0FX87_IGNLU|nr:hypothetical protein ILUMI_26782 [Ignelater luminosus]